MGSTSSFLFRIAAVAIWLLISLTSIKCDDGASDLNTRDTQEKSNRAPKNLGAFQISTDGLSKVPLVDGQPFLAEVIEVEQIGGDSMIILDNRQILHLFADNKFIKVLGKSGKGPCKYGSTLAYTAKGDTLIILDQTQSKVVMYSIETNECIDEISNPELYNFASVNMIDGMFYFTYGSYMSRTSPEKVILYRMGTAGNLYPLNLTKKDLRAEFLPVPVKMSTPTGIAKGRMYFVLPFTEGLWAFDPKTDDLSRVNVNLDIMEEADKDEITDSDKMMAILRRVEKPLELFLMDRFIALVTLVAEQGNPPENIWKVRFYTYDGRVVGVIDANDHIIDVDNNNISILTVSVNDANTRYPYVIRKIKYEIYKN